ncbi:putative dehydrogenase [Rhodobacter aestuarii]|uniref:Predicted dehydrogenase n=1 Tax=Rhodobacter aestuarii TaxID=453582 RepID=A0A1N7Q9G6_9RHOB|nr:Gfo/Idh/MocA family oxidoreductase [Rhodobacter aestuarii]PTV93781.1 putative dehydrogenase [Rhodobacter aestuarii]SIT19493.1 Predicted dehydrogenase [Rhodobacter aestuarii]
MVSPHVAVIGAGSIGRRHAGNLDALGAKVSHIGWREFDATAFAARTDLDAVVIATATQIRLPLIALCAQMGLPFYVEKPLTWSLEELAAIHAAAAPVAECSMVGFMMRYHPALVALGQEDLSDIYAFAFEIGHDVRQWRPNWRFDDSYAAQPEGGGVLLDLSHEVDIAQTLFPGLALQAVDSLGHAEFPGVDFATTLQLAAPGGPVGSVSMDYLSPVFIRRARLRGISRNVEIDFLKPSVSYITSEGVETRDYPFERNDMFLGAMGDFLKLVTDGPEAKISPQAPLLRQCLPTDHLVAEAWGKRAFQGDIDQDMG